MEWYGDLGDDSYKTLTEFLEGFKKKWGEKKEPRHLLINFFHLAYVMYPLLFNEQS